MYTALDSCLIQRRNVEVSRYELLMLVDYLYFSLCFQRSGGGVEEISILGANPVGEGTCDARSGSSLCTYTIRVCLCWVTENEVTHPGSSRMACTAHRNNSSGQARTQTYCHRNNSSRTLMRCAPTLQHSSGVKMNCASTHPT